MRMKRARWLRGTVLGALVAAAVISAGASAALAQQPPGPQRPPPGQPKGAETAPPPAPAKQEKPEYAIAVESALVNFDVLVTDEDGKVLSGLQKENFRVLDNGRPQAITNFAPVDEPITIVMLLEYSGSAYDYFAYKAATWGSRFLETLGPDDWVALVTYDLKPTIRVDFTKNKAEVQQVLASLSFPEFSESNMFDAIIDTANRLERVKGKTSILLITTGIDTFSSNSLGKTYQRLKESDATMFCVAVAESEFMAVEARGGLYEGANLTYFQAKNELDTFAKLTGGSAWFPRFEGELPSIFQSVAAFLRNQYRLGFSPSDAARDGKYHKLKVEVVGPDGKRLTVTNAKGKRGKVIVYAREGYVMPRSAAEK
jgi:VWFA-related protein